MNRTEEDEGRPILEFLEAVYTKYSTALSRHIAEEAGGDSDSILLAIHSFKLSESHVPQEQTEQKEEPVQIEQDRVTPRVTPQGLEVRA